MGKNKYKKIHKVMLVLIIFMAVLFVGCIGLLIFDKVQNESAKIEEKTSVTYSVYLQDGSTSTQEDGEYFLKESVNKINVYINYYNTNFTNYSLSGYISTYVKNSNSNQPYSMIGTIQDIKSNEKVISESTSVLYSIDCQEYINRISDYIGIQDGFENSRGKVEFVLTATNNLTKVSNKAIVDIEILDNEVKVDNKKEIDLTSDSGSSSDQKLFLAGALLAIMAALVLSVLDYFILKISKMDEFDRIVFTIFKLNKGVLVKGNNEAETKKESIIIVDSFKELLKVQDSVSLPILYNKQDDSYRFFIKVGSWEYCYILNKK